MPLTCADLNSATGSSDLTLHADSTLTRDSNADVWLVLAYHLA
jgi:hypothetical protein